MPLISFDTSENIRKPEVSDIFRGYQKRSVAWNELIIRFIFNFAKFGKIQIFSLFWQSIPKILQFVWKIASRRRSFCPLGKGLHDPSLKGYKRKSIHCIRLKIANSCKLKHWQKFQKTLRWLFIWVGWLDGE